MANWKWNNSDFNDGAVDGSIRTGKNFSSIKIVSVKTLSDKNDGTEKDLFLTEQSETKSLSNLTHNRDLSLARSRAEADSQATPGEAASGSSKKPQFNIKLGQMMSGWKVMQKLDEGGFGQVFKVYHPQVDEWAALKAEAANMEGGSAIKLESKILGLLERECGTQNKEHIPMLYFARKRKLYNYVVMTLLGDNLKNLSSMCPDEKVPVGTWARIGIQCMFAIKMLHDIGYVHRDIKPGNFMMGNGRDALRCRLVHVVDFGLARTYAAVDGQGHWTVRRARGSVEFRGTARYASPCVHEKFEQGRKDDLWSLMYMLIEMNSELPWQRERTRESLEQVKMACPDSVLVKGFPRELHCVIAHLRKLSCYNRPDYLMIYKQFKKVMLRVGSVFEDKFAWESEATYQLWRREGPKHFAHEDERFMVLDPIKINEGPQKAISTMETVYVDVKKSATVEEVVPPSSKG